MSLCSKKKTKVVRACLSKISSKLKKPKTNLEDKTRFIIKMSKFELINSASEDENNGTEESETSNDNYLPDFTKLQPYMGEPCVSKESLKENCPRKESSDSEEDTRRIGNTLWYFCDKYKPMATHAESICRLDKYKICERYTFIRF